jgi:CBS domain-containing protein
MKKVREFMNRKVFFVKPNHSVFDVAKVFSESNISGAPVVEDGRVVGMLSISDVVRFMGIKLVDADVIASAPTSLSILLLNLGKLGKDYLDFKDEIERISKTEVKHMMSKDVVCISPEANLFEAAVLMEKHDVNRLPVVEKDKLIGIIARADLIKALVD